MVGRERHSGDSDRRSATSLMRSFVLAWVSLLSICFAFAYRASAEPPRSSPPMVTEEVEKAIDRGLKYLVARQSADGSFRDQSAFGSYPVSMTALSGLAVAASGSTQTDGKYAPVVRKAVTYALNSYQRNGLICRPGGDEESRSMYGHGFSMLFLAEVMGMEEDAERLAKIRWVLQKGVDLTAKSQSGLGGWLYTPDMGGD